MEQVGFPIAVEVAHVELVAKAQAPCPRPTLAPSGDPIHGEAGPGRNPQLCLAIGHTTTLMEQVGFPIAVEVAHIEVVAKTQTPCPRPTAPTGDHLNDERGAPGRPQHCRLILISTA